MDATKTFGDSTETSRLSSLAEVYTDFDQWALRFSEVFKLRSHRGDNRQRADNVRILKNLNLNNFLIHGVMLHRQLNRNYDDTELFKVFLEKDLFDGYDYVVKCSVERLMSQYTRSKL